MTLQRWTAAENYMGERPTDKYVLPISETRDSDALDRSNMRVALRILGGESASVRVMRSDHWAVGWVEVILIDPRDTVAVQRAEEIVVRLADYPCLDEMDYGELQVEMGENTEEE